MASSCKAMPVVKTTYELVQRDLLIGNHEFQIQPTTTAHAPAKNIPPTFSSCVRRERSQCPVKTPVKVVAIAGIVLNNPSGSKTFPCFQMCGPNNQRSTCAARFPSLLRSAAPKMKVGTTVIRNQ